MGTSRQRVSEYLSLMKSFANNEFVISPRKKNWDFLNAWGIDMATAKDIVLSLQVSDYSAGPCSDDKQLPNRNDVWIFGKRLSPGAGESENEIEVYIKVVASQVQDGLGCLCVSFHESEWPMHYDFGGDGREIYILP